MDLSLVCPARQIIDDVFTTHSSHTSHWEFVTIAYHFEVWHLNCWIIMNLHWYSKTLLNCGNCVIALCWIGAFWDLGVVKENVIESDAYSSECSIPFHVWGLVNYGIHSSNMYYLTLGVCSASPCHPWN